MILLMIGAPEIICIVLIVLLLFGGKKIPELMRGLGKGVKSFQQGLNETQEEISKKPAEEQSSPKEEKQKFEKNNGAEQG